MVKNSRNLDYILSYLRTLDAEEWNRNGQLIQYFFMDPGHKPRILFELIRELIPHYSDEEITEHLGREYDDALLANLSTRIINVLHENLSLDTSLYKKGKFRLETQARVSVRKRLMQVHLMLQSGNTGKVAIYLDKTEAKARKFEFYEELLDLSRLRASFSSYRKDLGQLRQEQEERRLHQSRLQALEKAREELDLVQNLLLSNFEAADLQEQARNSWSWIKVLPDRHRSERLAWFEDYFRNLLWYAQEDFGPAKEQLRLSLERCRKRPELYGGHKTAWVLWLRAMIALREGRIQDVADWAEQALPELTLGAGCSLLVQDLLFRTYLVSGKVQKAQKKLDYLLSEGDCDHLQQKYHLYRASLAFRSGDRSTALCILREQSTFRSDIQGYNFFFRLLEVMISIEESDFDRADQVLQKLKRIWSHHKKRSGDNPRWDLIIRLLNQFNKIGFNRFIAGERWQMWVAELSDVRGNLAWDPSGAEILPFHEWIQEDVMSLRV